MFVSLARVCVVYVVKEVTSFRGSLVPRPPRPMGERRSGTVASNSWSKRPTSFPLKKDVHYNECPFLMQKTFDNWTKNLKQLFQTIFRP